MFNLRVCRFASLVIAVCLISSTGTSAQVQRDRVHIAYEVQQTAAMLDSVGAVYKTQCIDQRPSTGGLAGVCAEIGGMLTTLRLQLSALCIEGKFGRAKPGEAAMCP